MISKFCIKSDGTSLMVHSGIAIATIIMTLMFFPPVASAHAEPVDGVAAAAGTDSIYIGSAADSGRRGNPEPDTVNTDKGMENSSAPCRFTLKVGEYVIDRDMAEKLLRVRAMGLQPGSMPGPRRMMRMTRLTAGEYSTRSEAVKSLYRLKQSGVNGLVMRGRDDRYRILLGSYADQANANSELAKFVSRGIRVNSHRHVVPVPTKVLVAGSFRTKEEAGRSATRMEYLGVKCSLLEI